MGRPIYCSHPRSHRALSRSGEMKKSIHHRGAEFAEARLILGKKLFPPCTPRLGGEISESFFTAEAERSQSSEPKYNFWEHP